MKRIFLAALACGLAAASAAWSQAPARPQIATTKVDGTEGVYIFRNGNHQAMFVVTRDGVIATDPVAYGRPTGGGAHFRQAREVAAEPPQSLGSNPHQAQPLPGRPALHGAGVKDVEPQNTKERRRLPG